MLFINKTNGRFIPDMVGCSGRFILLTFGYFNCSRIAVSSFTLCFTSNNNKSSLSVSAVCH